MRTERVIGFAILAAAGITRLPAQHAATPTDPARERGAVFLSGHSRLELLACVHRHELQDDRRFDIAWEKDGRRLRCVLSRTPLEIAAMGDVEFEAWRRGWNAWREAERRRLHPSPAEVQGFGSAETRERLLQAARDLVLARDRGDFLRRSEERVERGWLSLLWLPRSGHDAATYSVPVVEVAALTDDAFLVWRRRFLRWIEVPSPGLPRPGELAAVSEAEFDAAHAQTKRSAARGVERALARFRERAGIALELPSYGDGRVRPVVADVAEHLRRGERPPQVGDTILVVEGRPVTEWDECIAAIDAYGSGSVLELVVAGRGEGAGATTRLLPLS